MFEKILVLYDFSWASRQALECGLRIGEKFHSHLKVFHVAPQSEGLHPEASLIPAIRREIDREVRKLSEKGEDGSLQALVVEVVAGRPLSSSLGVIERDAPNLVMLGTHGQKGVTDFLMGSVAEKIVRHSPSPVFVARTSPHWPPQSLLLPIEFDESADEALQWASELRRVFPLRVELVHVIVPEMPEYYPREMIVSLPVYDEGTAKKEAKARLEKLAADHPLLSARTHVVIGHPAAEIRRMAKETGSDIILIPTHGRTGLGRFLMGSVAEQVVRYASCHVLSFCPQRKGR